MARVFRLLVFSFLVGVSTEWVAKAEGPLPVTPAQDQQVLLRSRDANLAFNKKLIYDFWRTILIGRHLDQVSHFMRADYIQHNPNVDTGMDGFVRYFSKLGDPKPIPSTIPGLVSIQAEGDLVTLSTVNEQNEQGRNYTTTWFDMFRIQDGKIAEHWDCALKDKP